MPVGHLLSVIFGLLIFRQGPKDVPYSPSLTRALVPLSILTQWMMLVQVMPALAALLLVSGGVVGVILAVEMILRWRGLSNRAAQTLAALLAVNVVFNILLCLPWIELAPTLAKLQQNPGVVDPAVAQAVPAWAALAFQVVVLWGFTVAAHVMREAAEVGIAGGVLLAMTVLVVALAMMLCASTFTVAALRQ